MVGGEVPADLADLAVWLHPIHLDADWPASCEQEAPPAGPPAVAEPVPVQGLASQIQDKLRTSKLPTMACLAAEAASIAARSLDEQASSSIDSFIGTHVVAFDWEQRCLQVEPVVGGSPALHKEWQLEVPLELAEIAHATTASGRHAIAIVPKEGVGPGKYEEVDAESMVTLDPSVWLLLLDGRQAQLLTALDTLSYLGAVRAGNGLQESFALTQKALGSGGCATVYLAHSRGAGGGTGTPVAIKLAREAGSKADKALVKEMPLLAASQGHNNIVRLLGLFRAETPLLPGQIQWALALEFCSGGDLQELVAARGPQKESMAATITHGVLSAIAHIHERGVVHRDVKSENILIASGGRAVLTDFGVAAFSNDKEAMAVRCGSAGYVAPEVLKPEHVCTSKVDVFGVGVTLYFLLSATLPFSGQDVAQILRRNLRCKISLDGARQFRLVNMWAKNFMLLLLQAAPEDRPTASEALTHTWLTNNQSEKAEEHDQMFLRSNRQVLSPLNFNSPGHEGEQSPTLQQPPMQQPQHRHDAHRPQHQRQEMHKPQQPPQLEQRAPLVPMAPPPRTAGEPFPPPRRVYGQKSASQPLGSDGSSMESGSEEMSPTQSVPSPPSSSRKGPRPQGDQPFVCFRPDQPFNDLEDDVGIFGNEDSRLIMPEIGDNDLARSGGSQRTPMARQSPRALLRPKLGGGAAANAPAAPNFEMRMSESRQDHRRFRLMDGGPGSGSTGAASSNAGAPFSTGCYSDLDEEEDGRGSMDRGWASFGCFSDASGLNTPRTSFRGSFGRSPRGNSYSRMKSRAEDGLDRGSYDRLSHGAGSGSERGDSFNRVSWGSAWKQHAASHVAMDSQDDLPDMPPRVSNKSTRSTKSTGHAEKDTKKGEDKGDKDNPSRLSFRSLRKLRPTLSLRSSKASETQRAAAEASVDRVSFTGKGSGSSANDPLADGAEDLLTEGRMLMEGHGEDDADDDLWMSARSRGGVSRGGGGASGDLLFEEGLRDEMQQDASAGRFRPPGGARSGKRTTSTASSSASSGAQARRTKSGHDDNQARAVLPTPQTNNAARAAAISAAQACAEACAGSGAMVSPSSSMASRPTAAETAERGSEPRMSSRSLRGRLGSLVASRMGSLAR